MLVMMHYLNQTGAYRALYTNIENAQAVRENVQTGIQSVLSSLGMNARDLINDRFILENDNRILKERGPFSALEETLQSVVSP
ncbi:MAG: hypothetical protein LUQ50_12360 [Methanospirillum sp.]|uniref:hypothetical protein n=1 Tax=Methanospirillum sp. TaxID=45200 RepID=UPI00236D5650|nr:hypothetical protein [Methanospirillum sp.]MDD1729850.1 hypothetical protein [Methanospirillum sp.]